MSRLTLKDWLLIGAAVATITGYAGKDWISYISHELTSGTSARTDQARTVGGVRLRVTEFAGARLGDGRVTLVTEYGNLSGTASGLPDGAELVVECRDLGEESFSIIAAVKVQNQAWETDIVFSRPEGWRGGAVEFRVRDPSSQIASKSVQVLPPKQAGP